VSQLLPFLVAFAAFAAVAGALMWLATRVRRRGVGGDVMAVVDQIFRPTAYQSHHELRAQDERRAPTSAPDGD
jgi:hypothetical protein